jgi:hypothetical protein
MTKKKKLSVEEKEELKREGELPSRNVVRNENRQLIWFLVVIGAVFAAFLGTYFYIESLKDFEFVGVEWVLEEYEQLDIYHARFFIPYGESQGVTFNLFFRSDPRENDVSSDINISFNPEIIISQSERVMECKNSILVSSGLGEIGAMFPFFVEKVSGAMSSKAEANKWGVPFANCSSEEGKTVVVVRMSENGESSINVDSENPDCYLLNVGKCEENVLVKERFFLEIVSQLNQKEL